jgi:predicted Zn-dependent peptidase
MPLATAMAAATWLLGDTALRTEVHRVSADVAGRRLWWPFLAGHLIAFVLFVRLTGVVFGPDLAAATTPGLWVAAWVSSALVAVAFWVACLLLLASVTLPVAPLPALAAARRPAVPVPERLVLSNGLQVLLVERHDLPIVALQLVLRVGGVADPQDKVGLASMTAELLTRGAGSRSAAEIAEALDFVGASLAATCDDDKTTLRLDVLTKDLGSGIELFADALLRPTFALGELERKREQTMANLKSLLDDANAVLSVAASQLTYGAHPYGRLGNGTTASLGRITLDDVKTFHSRYYRPDRAFLVVVGDVSSADLRGRLEAALGSWQGQAAPISAPAYPLPATDRHVRLVDMDVNQAYIKLENIGIKRNHPEFFAAQLMAYILGGGAVGRLYRNIRDSQGLAYGAYSYLVPRYYAGKVTLELQTKIPSADRALESLLSEMQKMRDAGPTDDELALAKDFLAGSFALRLESNGDLAREVTSVQLYGLGDDYLAKYLEKVRGVTRQQAYDAARRYLNPRQYALTVVTKAAEIEGRLAKFGKVTRVAKEQLIGE